MTDVENQSRNGDATSTRTPRRSAAGNKAWQLSPDDSPISTQIIEDCPTAEMSSPSSLASSVNSEVTDALCEATGRLTVVDIQKADTIGIDEDDQYPRWDSLSGPPLDRLLFHLKNDEDCEDLLNFSMVSPYFRNEAKHFTKGADNRPGIKKLTLLPCVEDTSVKIGLFRSNIPFYDFTDLDWNRFTRVEQKDQTESKEGEVAEKGDESIDDSTPVLLGILSGPNDPAIEQLANLVSTTIQTVEIWMVSLSCFTMAEHLLRNATIGGLNFTFVSIDDTTAPLMLRIVSRLKPRSNALEMKFPNTTGLSDPESFVTSLCEGVTSLRIEGFATSFGLPISFWEKYLNSKLSSGAVGWIKVNNAGRITNTPINIDPNRRLFYLEWGYADDA